MVHVLAFNNVSAASLTKRLFVVRQPCRPPPVRTPVPGKVQVRTRPPTQVAALLWVEPTWGHGVQATPCIC